MSLAKTSHAPSSRSIHKIPYFTLFSLSHTHAHAYAYAYSLSLSFFLTFFFFLSLINFIAAMLRVTRESQGIGGGSGKSNRRLTASKNKPACNVQ